MKLKPENPALAEARTIHPKGRRAVDDSRNVLKPVANNSKLGKGKATISKGKWRGFPLFSITLEERATCPSTCLRWAECYGNAMPFAHRFQHGPELEAKIQREVADLARMHPHGFAVRLHVLGDFYSDGYVKMWRSLLIKHKNLHVYGYTAREGWKCLTDMRKHFPDRWWVRFSTNKRIKGQIVATTQGSVPGAVTCPEQTGKTESCLTCGLCWSVELPIEFIDHDLLHA